MATTNSQPIQLVTDSTSDIPLDVAKSMGINIIPLYVHFGNDSYRDNIDISVDDFYEKLVSGKISPKTSQPTPADFAALYKTLIPQGPVLSLHVSNKLSGTMNSAILGREEVLSEFPDAQIEIVDTFLASVGLGLVSIETKKAIDEGADFRSATELAKSLSSRTRIIVGLETLEYLVRGGRVGKAQGLVGSLLNLKPILQIIDGEVHPLEKVRTTRKSRARLLEIAISNKGKVSIAGVAVTTDTELANDISKTLKQDLNISDIPTFRIGPVVGTHGGPGAIAIAFILDE
jgi:DegV family protein with EDD domain